MLVLRAVTKVFLSMMAEHFSATIPEGLHATWINGGRLSVKRFGIESTAAAQPPLLGVTLARLRRAGLGAVAYPSGQACLNLSLKPC